MSFAQRLSSIVLLLAIQSLALAADDGSHLDLALTTLADDASGRSVDLNAVYTPSARWSIAAGGGTGDAGRTGAGLHGSSFNGNIDLHSAQWGIRPALGRWSDNDGFSSTTPELQLYWKRGGLRLLLQAERPGFALDYQLRLGTQAIARQFDFSGNGLGGGVEYYGEHWGAYANTSSYHYGDEVTRIRTLLLAPNLLKFPRLTLLASSMATLTHGALKDQASAGLEYALSRSSIHIDLTRVTDAISESHSTSYSAGLNYLLTPRFGVDLSGGTSHAEGIEDSHYANLILTLHW
jgi:hypothetical protein